MRFARILHSSFILALVLGTAACDTAMLEQGEEEAFDELAQEVSLASPIIRSANPVVDQYIVVLKEDASRGSPGVVAHIAHSLANRHGAAIMHVYGHALQGFAVRMPAARAEAMAREPEVDYIEEDSVRTASGVQHLPPWGLDRIDQREPRRNHAFAFNPSGAGVNVYVIDSGIRATHTEFGGRVIGAYTAINDGRGTGDCDGHGTAVAGVIGGSTYGVAKGARLHAVRVAGCTGDVWYTTDLIEGINWVYYHHTKPAVANLSVNGDPSTALDNAVKNSINAGITYVVGAGNDALDACGTSPARVATAITVGATNIEDNRWSKSNFGSCLDLFAPGASIQTASHSSDTASESPSGTSFAAPFVAGIAALHLQRNPAATPSQVAQALISSATTGKVINPGSGSPNRLAYCSWCTPSLAGGAEHTVVRKSDGTVWAWGSNIDGQLGDGTTTHRKTPVQVMGLSSIEAVAAGKQHTVALKSDGAVWAWGDNFYGQLGDGTTTDRKTPVQVPGLSGVVAIAAGDNHTVALKSDGTVWAWGHGYYGQVGDGTSTYRHTSPIQVPGLEGPPLLPSVTAISAGWAHTVVRKSDGTVWAWGWNGSGQIGDGTLYTRYSPVQVSGIYSVAAVAAGGDHAVALKHDGTLWAWGENVYGQLGDGTTTQRKTPVQVSGISGVSTMAAGDDHTVALKHDGTVWTWGRNYYGQLGDGTTTNRKTPVQLPAYYAGSAIAAGDNHTVTLKEDGYLWIWGRNYYGQLGDGTTTNRTVPIQLWSPVF